MNYLNLWNTSGIGIVIMLVLIVKTLKLREVTLASWESRIPETNTRDCSFICSTTSRWVAAMSQALCWVLSIQRCTNRQGPCPHGTWEFRRRDRQSHPAGWSLDRSKHYKALSECWEVSWSQRPRNVILLHLLFHMEVALTREEEMTVRARVCHSRDFFSFVLSCRAPDVQYILLSGEQTQQLKGRARRTLEHSRWGIGSCLHDALPKGRAQPPSSTPPEPEKLRHHRALAVQQAAELAWWQKGGRGLCQGFLHWFLSSLSCANPPVRWKKQCGSVGQGKAQAWSLSHHPVTTVLSI